jgi:carboxypeptidase T
MGYEDHHPAPHPAPRRRKRDGSIGVDPNRNYGYMWGTLDINTASQVPSDETYVAPRAFS